MNGEPEANGTSINRSIEEYDRLRKSHANDAASLAEAALFLEDVFRIVITDDEICEENLASAESMERFVLKKLVSRERPCAGSVES